MPGDTVARADAEGGAPSAPEEAVPNGVVEGLAPTESVAVGLAVGLPEPVGVADGDAPLDSVAVGLALDVAVGDTLALVVAESETEGVCEGVIDGDAPVLKLAVGVAVPDGVAETLELRVPVPVGDPDAVGVTLGLAPRESELVGVGVGVGGAPHSARSASNRPPPQRGGDTSGAQPMDGADEERSGGTHHGDVVTGLSGDDALKATYTVVEAAGARSNADPRAHVATPDATHVSAAGDQTPSPLHLGSDINALEGRK